MQGLFLETMHDDRSKQTRTLTPAQFAGFVTPTFQASAADAKVIAVPTLYESLSDADTPFTRPFFDCDFKTSVEPDGAAVDGVLAAFVANIEKLMAPVPEFQRATLPAERHAHLRLAQRHGWLPAPYGKPRVYKVSFRAWIVGFRVRYTTLAKLVKNAGIPPAETPGGFDVSVYSTRRLLGCVGCAITVFTRMSPPCSETGSGGRHLDRRNTQGPIARAGTPCVGRLARSPERWN